MKSSCQPLIAIIRLHILERKNQTLPCLRHYNLSFIIHRLNPEACIISFNPFMDDRPYHTHFIGRKMESNLSKDTQVESGRAKI